MDKKLGLHNIAKIITMRYEGYSVVEIAEVTEYSVPQIHDYIREFKAGGIDAVRPKRRGRPSKYS